MILEPSPQRILCRARPLMITHELQLGFVQLRRNLLSQILLAGGGIPHDPRGPRCSVGMAKTPDRVWPAALVGVALYGSLKEGLEITVWDVTTG